MRDAEPTGQQHSARDQLVVWFTIGTQSVGGGSATLYLMRRVLIEQRRWVRAADFLEDWTLSRLSPGVTLIALTALLGRRIGGRSGVALALGGMLGPAAVITALLTAFFGVVATQPFVIGALDGMGPATIGMMIGMTVYLARSAMRRDRRAVVDLAVVGAALAVGFAAPGSPLIVLLGGAIIGAVLLGQGPGSETPPETT